MSPNPVQAPRAPACFLMSRQYVGQHVFLLSKLPRIQELERTQSTHGDGAHTSSPLANVHGGITCRLSCFLCLDKRALDAILQNK